eukprot:scaffold30516_cov27-Tisochrysis_lutea.AAC.1
MRAETHRRSLEDAHTPDQQYGENETELHDEHVTRLCGEGNGSAARIGAHCVRQLLDATRHWEEGEAREAQPGGGGLPRLDKRDTERLLQLGRAHRAAV